MPRFVGVSLLASLLVTAGCRPEPDRSSTPVSDDAQVEAEQARAEQAETPAGEAPAARAQPIVLITEPAQLARLTHARDFGALVFGQPATSTRELHALAEYRELVSDLDLDSGPHAYKTPRWWFNHPETSLSLVAVVNRIDRRDFSTSGCGETRLIFRLGYAEADGVQRMPVALNLVFAQPDDGRGCTEIARRWMVAEGADPIDALAREGGPLAPAMLTREHLLALESNVRISEDRAAAADNELRVFAWVAAEQRLRPTSLEWQPAYKEPIVRSKMRPLLTPERLADIERGAGLPPDGPDGLHAEWATVSLPNGWENSPFMGIWQRLEPDDFPLPKEGLLATGDGVQHRLDGMSCSGCHAMRSVAGFHLPGAGGSEQLLGGVSAHMLAELPWRARYVEALANGEAPDRTRNLHNDGPPGFGRHCSIERSPIDSLACDPGFVCAATNVGNFGVCLPEGYEGPSPCERSGPQCGAPSAWFPGGFVRKPCVEGHPCAPVPVTTDYAACRETDDPWACAHQQADQTRVDGCARQSDCRDGYACVAGSDGAGVCLPTTTLAEFRLIGHATRLR